MSGDYPIDHAYLEILRTTMEAHPRFWDIVAPKGYTTCPHCKCHLVWDKELKSMRHKNPKKGQACLLLRRITTGAKI